MPAATIIALIEALVQFAPEIPALVQSIGTIKTLIAENRAPTAEEQAAIDAGLDAAHAALQAAAQRRPPSRPDLPRCGASSTGSSTSSAAGCSGASGSSAA